MKKQRVSTGIKELLGAIAIFDGLPDNDIDILQKSATQRCYKKGEHLYLQGDEANRLSIIKDGWVRHYRGNANGEEGAAWLCTRGDILGERALISGSLKHFFSAQATSDTSVINIPGPIVKEIINKNPDVLSKMMLELIQKIGHLHVENEHMAMLSAPQRVACLLLRLSSHMHGNGGTFTFPYDKSLAALQLGMKRETFSRALACLRRYGVSCGGSEIVINSFSRLSESCCSHCSLNSECSGARLQIYPVNRTEAG